MYQFISKFLTKIFKKSTVFKYGFNWSPMYRRSTGRIYFVSEDLQRVEVKIPLSYRNSNYVGSIFGGSLFSSTDPIYMVQLINIMGKEYVIWDKDAKIKFKKPVKETGYVSFEITDLELEAIKKEVAKKGEINLKKEVAITNKEKSITFAEVSKTIYIADKKYYKQKRKQST